jgi:hypothetical protein
MTTSALTKFLSIFSSASIAIVAVMSSAKADIFDANVYCRVTGIRTGQLALRYEPTGTAFAGLDNGDKVQAIGGNPGKGITWYSIKVLQSSNPKVNGKEGVVNAKYLTCDWYDFDGKFIRRD